MITRDALIDGPYRYWLRRGRLCEGDRQMTFVMLNPSTADADKDDATLRRCMGFAKREKCATLVVVNLYAYRATHPDDLWAAHHSQDITGPRNWYYVDDACWSAHVIVAAWGAHGVRFGAGENMKHRLRGKGLSVCHLGLTQDLQPKHPLRLRTDTPLQQWF